MFDKKDNMYDVFPYVMKYNFLQYKKNFNLDINGKTYYFKTGRCIFQELVVSEIFKMLGIPCVEYELVKLWNKYYIMSSSYRVDGFDYQTGLTILENYIEDFSFDELKELGIDLYKNGVNGINNIELLWLALEKKQINKDDISNIIENIIKYYSMQIILSDSDMHGENYEIAFKGDRAFLTPKYDNEGCFSKTNEVSFSVDSEDACNNPMCSLKKFINYSDRQNREIFTDLYYACTPYIVSEAVKKVLNKYGEEIPKLFNELDVGRMDLYINKSFENNYKKLEMELFDLGYYR